MFPDFSRRQDECVERRADLLDLQRRGDGQRVDADPQAMLMRDEHVCDQSHGLGICVLNEWALIL